MHTSKKRLKRSLYRLSAGQLTLKNAITKQASRVFVTSYYRINANKPLLSSQRIGRVTPRLQRLSEGPFGGYMIDARVASR